MKKKNAKKIKETTKKIQKTKTKLKENKEKNPMKQENKEKILKYPTTNIIIYYKKMKQIQKKIHEKNQHNNNKNF